MTPRISKVLLACALGLWPMLTSAEAISALAIPAWEIAPSDSNGKPIDLFDSSLHENTLISFNPSDLVLAEDHNETRIQFLLSLKYELIPLESFQWHLGNYRLMGLNFAYDGLYDFYLWTRYSYPIVSRTQNPGFYFSFEAPQAQRLWDIDSINIGWFHESNGQIVNTASGYNALLAQEGFEARDSISHGWDYWYLASKFSFHPWDGTEVSGTTTQQKIHMRLSFTPSLRIFTGAEGIFIPAEQAVFWDPQDPPSYIYDYDGIRGLFNAEWLFPHRAFNYLGLGAEFKTGYNTGYFGHNWSKRFTITFKTWHLPWYFYYYTGYDVYISDYSTWSDGYGFGIRIW